jgi:hypothetical protein
MKKLKQRLLRGVLKPLYGSAAVPTILAIESRLLVGTNVFSRDWDVLVILDTCRVDALQEASNEYKWLPPGDKIGSIFSTGSATKEWIAATFTERYREEIENTVYVTSTSQSKRVLEDRVFPEDQEGIWAPTNWQTVEATALHELVNAWEYARPEIGFGLHPAILTDIAIEEYRTREPDRMIVHFAHPHHPFGLDAVMENREMTMAEEKPFDYLMQGGNRDEVWELYMRKLEIALPYVGRLLSAVDAPKAVISADHGDAFGEFSFYSHPFCAPIPSIRKVPWAEFERPGEDDYEPRFDRSLTTKKRGAETLLRDLGYQE